MALAGVVCALDGDVAMTNDRSEDVSLLAPGTHQGGRAQPTESWRTGSEAGRAGRRKWTKRWMEAQSSRASFTMPIRSPGSWDAGVVRSF